MGFSGKNCEMFLGQFICLIARERIPAKKAIESAHRLEFWHVIEDHLRIPRHPATQSALIWPGIPRPSGHLFHGHPAGQSERSDAGVALLV